MKDRLHAILIDYDEDLFDLSDTALAAMAAQLEPAGALLQVGQWRSEQAVLQAAAQADLVLVQSLRPLLTATVIGQLSRCRGIVRVGIGYDSLDLAAATQTGIPVSNVVGWCDHEVAEHALALLLDCARCLGALDRSVRRGEWARKTGRSARRVSGKTLGLVGLGRIGATLARMATGLGLRVLAYDPHLDPQQAQQRGAQLVDLASLLETSDFISLHLPLTASTQHLIGAAELARIKPGAVLVNTSRGGIVDEDALVRALLEGRLGAAGLDVFAAEPLPAGSPLCTFDNVILSPHLGSYSQESVLELYTQSAQVAASLLAGRWVESIVNPQVRPQAEARWQRLNVERGG